MADGLPLLPLKASSINNYTKKFTKSDNQVGLLRLRLAGG